MMTVAVIPCYNESGNAPDVVKDTAALVDEVVVVDDGSDDTTREAVLGTGLSNLTVLSHVINSGKGAAARTGCDYAFYDLKADRVVLLDGDGQHDPNDIERFTNASDKGAEIVYGMRKRTKEMPLLFRFGNWVLTTFTKVLFGDRIADTQCGYRLLTRKAYDTVRWDANDYSMESEMIARAGLDHLPHRELMIKTVYHERYKGTTPKDGIKIALRMLKWRVLLW